MHRTFVVCLRTTLTADVHWSLLQLTDGRMAVFHLIDAVVEEEEEEKEKKFILPNK